MDKAKKWAISVMTATLLMLSMIGAVVIIVDPFFQYHQPLERLAYPIYSDTYQNPGIVKHFEYDSVISGSSMTQNFKTSWFQDLMGLNTIKVPYAGGRAKNMHIIFDSALRSKQTIEKIFWGLDIYALEQNPDSTRNPLPMYLYNNNYFDDVSYIFNKDVVLTNIKAVLVETRKGGRTASFDDAYFWEKNYTFGQQETLDSFAPYLIAIQSAKPAVYDDNYLLNTAKQNLTQNIIPLIEQYPETEFYIFFPPYSILYWYDRALTNQSQATIVELTYTIETLLKYDNVRLFYFQNIEEIVGNLDFYKDYTHYNSNINYYMTQCFVNGDHRLTSENYVEELEKLKNMVEQFDYSQFGDGYRNLK